MKIPHNVVYIRAALAEENELANASKYFTVARNLMDVAPGSFVVPRYSFLPYPEEVEYNLKKLGCSLINSLAMHKWIANFEWYNVPELAQASFESWNDDTICDAPKNISYIVKGRTNSRKFDWNSSMFAHDRLHALKIAARLAGDSLIGPQGIIYRRYEPLETYEVGINGLPFTNEWRFFFLQEQMIAGGYYWSIAENIPQELPNEATVLAKNLAQIACKYANFFVLDIAKTQTGEWKLVEINDGCQSGLSCISADKLYSNLKFLLPNVAQS